MKKFNKIVKWVNFVGGYAHILMLPLDIEHEKWLFFVTHSVIAIGCLTCYKYNNRNNI